MQKPLSGFVVRKLGAYRGREKRGGKKGAKFFCYYIKKCLYICKFYWFATTAASQCKLV
jgi:hypothetical protein